jgi:hypothetical protein
MMMIPRGRRKWRTMVMVNDDVKSGFFFSSMNLGISDFRDLMKLQVSFSHKGIFVRPLHN